MDSDKLSIAEMVEYYKPDVESLTGYIPWLQAHKGDEKTAAYYNENGLANTSITFPVYDGTLMGFVKAAQASTLMNRNYAYVYSRNRIRSVRDERRFIQRATIKEMGDLWAILSRYILKGMTKSSLWSEGVENGIFLELLLKMREILAFWDTEGKRREEN